MEVPPNIEVEQIVSGSSPLLSYSSNPLLSKDDSKLLIFPVVGNPFANATSMILVIIRMRVLAEKRKELSQTISSLIGSKKKPSGCRAASSRQNSTMAVGGSSEGKCWLIMSRLPSLPPGSWRGDRSLPKNFPAGRTCRRPDLYPCALYRPLRKRRESTVWI